MTNKTIIDSRSLIRKADATATEVKGSSQRAYLRVGLGAVLMISGCGSLVQNAVQQAQPRIIPQMTPTYIAQENIRCTTILDNDQDRVERAEDKLANAITTADVTRDTQKTSALEAKLEKDQKYCSSISTNDQAFANAQQQRQDTTSAVRRADVASGCLHGASVGLLGGLVATAITRNPLYIVGGPILGCGAGGGAGYAINRLPGQ